MNMERERNLSIVPFDYGTGMDQFGASSSSLVTVKVENEEEEEDTSLTLTQWLNPTKLPLSYLDMLNEEPSTTDEKAPNYVVKKVVLPSTGPGGGGGGGRIRTLYSGSETENIGSSMVKPSIRVQSRNYNDEACVRRGGIRTLYSASERENIGSSMVKPSIRVQSRNNNYETCGSSSKVPVGKRSARNKSQILSPQFYVERLRSWKSNNINNRDFSQVFGKHRDVPSKKVNNNKKRPYAAEHKRKQIIDENIKELGKLLPHETENAPELILDDVIAHVKLLQLQMKELTRSRLGGEAITHPMISIEGFGNYIHHEQMKTKSLEDIMADLLANDFEAAASFLETKGLYLMPLSSV